MFLVLFVACDGPWYEPTHPSCSKSGAVAGGAEASALANGAEHVAHVGADQLEYISHSRVQSFLPCFHPQRRDQWPQPGGKAELSNLKNIIL